MFPARLYPPRIFPGRVFPKVGRARTLKPSDAEVFDAIARLLRRTGQFGDVTICRDEQIDALVGGKGSRLLVVTSDKVASKPQPVRGRRLRVVDYELVTKVEIADAREAFARLKRLAAVTRRVLEEIEYTPYCLYDYSRVLDEHVDGASAPVYMLGIRAQFAYVVDTAIGMKETA